MDVKRGKFITGFCECKVFEPPILRDRRQGNASCQSHEEHIILRL